VAANREAGGAYLSAPGGAAVFLRQNIVCSVEAEIGMEGQIMCVEKYTIYMSLVVFLGPQNAPKSSWVKASPQTPLWELTALTQTP